MATTKVSIKSTDSTLHYTAENEQGHTIMLSGDDTAVGSMESVLMAIASCSSIDIVLILKKMKQDLKDIEVNIEGDRAENPPRVYTKVRIHYILYGDVKEKKAEQAIDLSLGKYCSVSQMLKTTVDIISTFEVRSEK